jgi:hypothetical protein
VTLPRKQPIKRGTKGLARSGPPERKTKLRPYSAKAAKIKRAMKSQEDLFRATFTACAVCGYDGVPYRPLGVRQLHHIVGGGLRSTKGHRRENWIMLCNQCHTQIHRGYLTQPPLTNGNVLWAKREVDREYFNLSVIKFLHSGPQGELPDDWQPKRPDQFYLGA